MSRRTKQEDVMFWVVLFALVLILVAFGGLLWAANKFWRYHAIFFFRHHFAGVKPINFFRTGLIVLAVVCFVIALILDQKTAAKKTPVKPKPHKLIVIYCPNCGYRGEARVEKTFPHSVITTILWQIIPILGGIYWIRSLFQPSITCRACNYPYVVRIK
jgi:heme/copper-type cytochrome/quinol oxidase subunit 2